MDNVDRIRLNNKIDRLLQDRQKMMEHFSKGQATYCDSRLKTLKFCIDNIDKQIYELSLKLNQ